MSLRCWALCAGLLCGGIGAQEPQSDELVLFGERLAKAREGELVGVAPIWLQIWELPDELRIAFEPPRFSMRVPGEDGYVVLRGRVMRPGDRAAGHRIVAIEREGVVLDVKGYPVLVQ